MSLYIWFWRVTRDKPFAITTGLTFFFYIWLILVPIVGVIFFRLWCVRIFLCVHTSVQKLISIDHRVGRKLVAATDILNEIRAMGFDESGNLAHALDLSPTKEELAEQRTRSWSQRPWKVQSYIHYFIYWILAMLCYIPPIELSLRQNVEPQDGSSAWSFGQVRRVGGMLRGLSHRNFLPLSGLSVDCGGAFSCGFVPDDW